MGNFYINSEPSTPGDYPTVLEFCQMLKFYLFSGGQPKVEHCGDGSVIHSSKFQQGSLLTTGIFSEWLVYDPITSIMSTGRLYRSTPR